MLAVNMKDSHTVFALQDGQLISSISLDIVGGYMEIISVLYTCVCAPLSLYQKLFWRQHLQLDSAIDLI